MNNLRASKELECMSASVFSKVQDSQGAALESFVLVLFDNNLTQIGKDESSQVGVGR